MSQFDQFKFQLVHFTNPKSEPQHGLEVQLLKRLYTVKSTPWCKYLGAIIDRYLHWDFTSTNLTRRRRRSYPSSEI